MMLTNKTFYAEKLLADKCKNKYEIEKAFELAVQEAINTKNGKLLIDVATKFAKESLGYESHSETKKGNIRARSKNKVKQVTEVVSGVEESNNGTRED